MSMKIRIHSPAARYRERDQEGFDRMYQIFAAHCCARLRGRRPHYHGGNACHRWPRWGKSRHIDSCNPLQWRSVSHLACADLSRNGEDC